MWKKQVEKERERWKKGNDKSLIVKSKKKKEM